LNVDTLAVFQKTDVKCQYTDGGEDFIGMAIFSGSSNRSGYPQCTICTSAKNFTYKSHTNELFLMLKHPMKSVMPDADGNFFIASVNFVGADTNNKDECGGIVEVSSTRTTAVHSPRYPEEYERGTECQWLFKAPPGYYIVYTIREYITPNAHEQQTEKKWIPRAISNLTCQDPLPMIEGALTIYGGNSTKSEKIERICLDIDQPKEIPVFASESLVTFRGAAVARIHMTGEDQHVKKIGFLLEARPACGGLVLADDIEQVITFRDLDEELCNVTIRKKDESASGIYARLDEFSPLGGPPPRGSGGGVQFGNNFIEIQIDGGEKMSRETEGQVDATPTHEEFRAKNEIRINYVKRNSLLATKMVIAYSTLIENCGAEVTSRRGVISIPEIDGDFDCEWTLRENPGNSIRASLKTLRTPYSPNCTDSYVEFRKWNVSGPLIGRWCGMETTHGGITTSHVIQQPLLPLTDTYIEATWIVEGDPDKALLVHIDQIKVPYENDIGFKTMKKTGLVLSPAWDMKYVASQTERPGNVRVVGFVPPADVGYENNVHCKWTIERPIMTGLRVKITMLSLEDAVACPFDFIALLPDLDSSEDNGDSFHAGQKYCRFTDVNTTLDYSYNKFYVSKIYLFDAIKILYVHFVTDRSRSGQGFRLQFRLTCNSFDYIRPTYGLLDHILTSPGYPKSEADQVRRLAIRSNLDSICSRLRAFQKCMWSIVVASNRRIGFEILDLDLEKTDGCTTDVLSVVRYCIDICFNNFNTV
uniref:CUB domain-containing protein n=1 Tax=Angiostrongylus cantonensis TaxID=6313 RepID=A0A158PC92_ANGCA